MRTVGRMALPVVPPTPERVEHMLSGTDRDPDELIAAVPTEMGESDSRKGRN